MIPWLTSAAILALAWVVLKVVEYRRLTLKLGTIPQFHSLFVAGSLPGDACPPRYPKISRGGMWSFLAKHKDYDEKGWNVTATLAPFPRTTGMVWVADVGICKSIAANRAKYPKPLEMYEAVSIYGKNVIAAEGDEWKRHRKISQPAFSEQNNRLVFNSAIELMNELFDEVWAGKDTIYVPHALEITVRIALMILGIAAFGKKMTWQTDSDKPSNHKMDFTTALYNVSTDLAIKFVAPKWAMKTTKKMREIETSFEELGLYMDEMITERRKEGQEKREGKWDLLTNLISASDGEGMEGGVDSQLTFSELKGNIFIYLLAGHETNAHSLVFTLGLMALYPDEQEKLYQHIKSVLGDRQSTYEDFPQLTRSLAVYMETIRMFPPVNGVPKVATEDTIVQASSADPKSNETRQMVIPAGSAILLHSTGVHYNPRYWEDPFTFKPERFMGDWNRDAFLSFSAGARSCIGRKFSEVEGVAVLTPLFTNFTVHLAPEEEEAYKGLTVHEKTDRLLKSMQRITVTPIKVPLIFRRRK